MNQSANLLLFFIVVFGVVVLPGLDMAFVLASSLSGGRRSGFYAVAGIVAGGICHVAIGALGIAVVLNTIPQLFNLVLLAGAVYLGWIGISLMRSGAVVTPIHLQAAIGPARSFHRGMLTNLLNPKAYLFMLAVFPQFVRADYGPMWSQALLMGVVIALTQAAVYGMIALLAGGSRHRLASDATWSKRLGRVIGAVLLLAALSSLAGGWRH
ncbi:MAG: LysE family translocator [Pseudomonadota bacterium]